ncbi:MAG: biotin attachment protein [Candidatus Omnitrophica bacterium]|nr:biotin attachment protein [Candidatus Omnitrophota bacterium]MBU1048031.1 biotin attachment protein [Candidatus Omnitrophota bacterium]MBU1631258.1 biotin attachment protein [Candidatus Omnitrophota bacterium]MBU1767071.1 biotin attachment protein [Candidatus Omnitrophota bacterium]MBU1889401.1 biotin attachment protein [Candidatus Omnitrophota bacterium]
MIKEIIIPKLGETIKEAAIDKWRKKEGDKVTKGEVLVEIMTDKAVLEVESLYDGFLREILKKEGDTVPVLSVIGYIADSMDEEITEVGKTEEKSDSQSEHTFSCPLNVKKVKNT